MTVSVGILSIGDMGLGMARLLQAHGYRVLTVAAGRSQDTVDRIKRAAIEALPTDQDLVVQADYILSIVPPRDALATARRVQEAIQLADTLPRRAERGGATAKPYFFDLNAISPRSVREIAALFSDEKEDVLAHFLDGGIIGSPPSLDTSSQTWKRPSVVMSGSVELPATFSALAETLNMKMVGPKIGSASVLKLSFASLTKGLTALTILSFSTAQAEDVLPQLLEHLNEYSPRAGASSTGGITGMAPKAYRWVEEMRAIGEAFDSEGHWDGVGSSVYGAFAEVYRRVAEDTVLGQEKVGQRQRGQTAEDVASIVAAANLDHRSNSYISHVHKSHATWLTAYLIDDPNHGGKKPNGQQFLIDSLHCTEEGRDRTMGRRIAIQATSQRGAKGGTASYRAESVGDRALSLFEPSFSCFSLFCLDPYAMADDRRQLPSQPLPAQAQLQPHHPPQQNQPQSQQQQQIQQQVQQQAQQQQQQQQAALSSARLQHFNYLAPSSQVSVQPSVQAQQQQQQQQHYLGLSAPERRHYSFDTDRDSRRFSMSTTLNMDYDQTEGLGGLSVSSYESIDDDRSEPAIRGYHFSSDKHINYPMPEQVLPYSASPLYPSIPYQIDELGHAPGNYTPSDVSSSISPPNGQIGNNKYSTVPSGDRLASALGLEEQSRMTADEDKRRRNTAASARFRVKKKQREQALERTVREASEINASLEARVAQLEMENRWLKNLLTEKNENLNSRMPPPPPPENSLPLTQTDPHAAGNQKPIQPKRTVGVGTDN
ncbi:hypothetical protein PISL3812_07043 [Talaromyces islandicus]|uniref:BZIP domain-containing protein n=1 Tax=Talaromyces islandicus TaxID=28573 RepID=A0A0U1M3N5_TALIS|nr:hypothetical protein PISL3812_07043 [Talaromyces islandicus]